MHAIQVCVCVCLCVYTAAPALGCLQAQLRQTFLQQHDRSLDNLGPFWQGYLESGERLDRLCRLLMQRLKPVSRPGDCLVRLGGWTQVPRSCCSSSGLVDWHSSRPSGIAVQGWTGPAGSC